MPDPWFTETGAAGTIQIKYNDDELVATTADTDQMARCILQENLELSPADAPYRISGTVSKYIIGSGNRTDYLYFDPDSGRDVTIDEMPDQGDQPETSAENSLNIKEEASYPYRELADINGSEDYVSIVARLDHIYWVDKDGSDGPDLKGRLTDDSIDHGVAFVIGEGVPHPYLDEDMWFLFDNVYDYYWEANDQTTIWISEHTEFTKLRPVTNLDSSTSTTQSKPNSAESPNSGSDKTLDQIAKDTIGDTTFTVDEKDESSISKAKQKAKDQQRDPAIDPKLQSDENKK